MKAELGRDYETLVRYFLGELDAPEQEQVEERYMLEEPFAELRDEVELDLVDAYAAGTLSPEQRRHFETRYLTTGERRQAVQAAYLSLAYRASLPQAHASAPRKAWGLRMPRPLLTLAASFGLLIIGCLLWLLLRSGAPMRHEGGNVAKSLRGPKPPKQAPVPPAAPLAANQPHPPGPSPAQPPPKVFRLPPQEKADRQPVQEARAPLPAPPELETDPNAVPGQLSSDLLPPPSLMPYVPRLVVAHIDGSAVKAEARSALGAVNNVDVATGVAGLLTRRLQAAGVKEVESGNPGKKISDTDGYRLSAEIVSFRSATSQTKALVTINYRVTDLKTGQIVKTGQVTGQSDEMLHGVGAMLSPRWIVVPPDYMLGRDFAHRAIGQATLDACGKLADVLTGKPAKP